MSSPPVFTPVSAPVLPMLAKRVDEVPTTGEWLFEPKWDGFRVLMFRDGDDLLLQSRDTKPLNRYFPEVAEALKATLPPRCVLDGEIVIAQNGRLEFDLLSLRIHPAASRIKLLAGQTPASVVFFDLLAVGDEDLRTTPFAARRALLSALLANTRPPVHLTPSTGDAALARDWFQRFEGAGLDGVIAKPAAGLYESNKRTMLKIKHERECDCVVGGFRWHKDGEGSVGSLLLGLYNAHGQLQHVGVCASFAAAKRRELTGILAAYRENALASHPWAHEVSEDGQRIPGAPSRWNADKDLSWMPLRPELVVEVTYEHMQGDRFRHLAHFRRWRPDKPPAECTYEQLEVVAPHELADIFPPA